MSISTLSVASLPRSSDFAQISQNEYTKGMQEQATVQRSIEKDINTRNEIVVKKDENAMGSENYDAKEKSRNEYVALKAEKKKKEKKDGAVTIKGTSSFDIKI